MRFAGICHMSIPVNSASIGDIGDERCVVLGRFASERLSLDTAETFLRSLPRERFASWVYRQSRRRPYVQPRGGFPSFAKQRALTIALDDAGADFIPLTIDSHTRHNRYDTASALLAAGLAQDRDLLNGYPLVSHGITMTRRLFEGIDKPVSLRHGTPDARLLTEIALASGITEIEGGGLSYTLPYSRGFPLGRALTHWQYVDRLCAITAPHDTSVHRESFGPLTATLVPPVMTIVVQLCELLLAAEQGITSFAVSFGQTGSIEQDIAIACVLRRQCDELLARFGFSDLRVALVYHQWMGAFPVDRSLAWQLIAVSAAISRVAGADKVVIKTVDEAVGIPSIESNVAAVRAVDYVLEMVPEACALVGDVVDEECELINSEVVEVMGHIFALPGNTFLSAVQRAVISGVIDVPFSPHDQNAGRLMACRGIGKRIRILDPAAVPISADSRRRERILHGPEQAQAGPLWERLLRDIRLVS
jgi:methylaspartate mutase epsilon subunit